jgi:hypothetical protein
MPPYGLHRGDVDGVSAAGVALAVGEEVVLFALVVPRRPGALLSVVERLPKEPVGARGAGRQLQQRRAVIALAQQGQRDLPDEPRGRPADSVGDAIAQPVVEIEQVAVQAATWAASGGVTHRH